MHAYTSILFGDSETVEYLSILEVSNGDKWTANNTYMIVPTSKSYTLTVIF